MIEFTTWLPQIIGYCEFVTDEVKIRRAWLNHDFSDTSVTDFDEMYEQIFDDLDANYFVKNLEHYLPNAKSKSAAIAQFIISLINVDEERANDAHLKDPVGLLKSLQWQVVRKSANAVLEAFEVIQK